MNIKDFRDGFRRGMKIFGNNVSVIINSALLLIVYVFGVGMTALVAKIFKKKFLDKELSKGKESYWSELDLKKKPIKEYYKQF